MALHTPQSTKMSEWNANLGEAYRSLPAADLARFKSLAASKNSERLSAEQNELRCAKHAAEMTSYMQTMMKTWQSQSGWVGWCVMGGLDENGQPVYHSGAKTGKDHNGLSLQERLAREFKCTPVFIDGIVLSWVLGIFDAPQASMPLSPSTTVVGSGPAMSLSAVTGNISPKQPARLSPGHMGDQPIPERAAVVVAVADPDKPGDAAVSRAADKAFNPFDETFSSDDDDRIAGKMEQRIQKKDTDNVIAPSMTLVPKLPPVEVAEAQKTTQDTKPKGSQKKKSQKENTPRSSAPTTDAAREELLEPAAKKQNSRAPVQKSTRDKKRAANKTSAEPVLKKPFTLNEAISKALRAMEPAKKSVRPRPKAKATQEKRSSRAGHEPDPDVDTAPSAKVGPSEAMKASAPVVTRAGRVRVPTARSLEESPDMSAAKRLHVGKKRTCENGDGQGAGKKARRA
ncbi:hypothetical protein BD311DRAFT_657210 [Dichomitus squalens]|uniref:Uncharacterized protein n=1 Tax=Dichomitus squalens TaxID=114155 RepID=A0A4Q9MU67_9APHY|nr:hypothetical protein BD311DRAFT_657210 [Dichomitus squalens]